MKMEITMENVAQFKEVFNDQYRHVSIGINNKAIKEFLEQDFIQKAPFEKKLDLFYDYLLSQGLCEVDE